MDEKEKRRQRMTQELKSTYDSKRGIIYKNEIAIQKNIEMLEKMELFENSKSKPLMLLDSNQLSRVIFFHQSQLNKLKVQKMVEDKREKNYNIISQVNNFNPTGSEYNTLLGQKTGQKNGFFMTEAKQNENTDQEEYYNPPTSTAQGTKLKLYRSTRQGRTYSGQLERGQPWRNKKRRQTTKLRIDAKRNKIPFAPTAIPLDKNQLLLEELICKRPKGGQGANHFLPTHKVRKHPQLEKIEQYFVRFSNSN